MSNTCNKPTDVVQNPKDEVVSWAQSCLIALNCGDVKKDSKLHHKLREVMIKYRHRLAHETNQD